MKEAVGVKRVRGVSPEVIAVLPGEATGRVGHLVRVRGRVVGGEQRSSLYRLIGCEDQVS